jgi:PEP-CTERM motif
MKKVLLVVLFLAFATARASRADDIYNSLGGPTAGSDSIGGGFGPLADSFSTSSTAFDLTNIDVLLQGEGSGSSTITAYLLADNPDDPNNAPFGFAAPGTTLDVIGSQAVDATITGSQIISFSTSLLLDPNTRYWIELTSNNGNVDWDWTGDASGTGVADEFFSSDGLGVWLSGPNSAGPWQMEVSGVVPTPEPSTIVLMLVGIASLLGAATLRKKNPSVLAAA